jgi:hypothetical protein
VNCCGVKFVLARMLLAGRGNELGIQLPLSGYVLISAEFPATLKEN